MTAQVYINGKREEEAGIRIYEDVIAENRAGYNWLAGARFELADLASRRGRPEEEKRRLDEIVEKYPQSGWAKPAEERLADIR